MRLTRIQRDSLVGLYKHMRTTLAYTSEYRMMDEIRKASGSGYLDLTRRGLANKGLIGWDNRWGWILTSKGIYEAERRLSPLMKLMLAGS